MPPVLKRPGAVLVLVLCLAPLLASEGDRVYHLTLHGSTTGGVARDPALPTGSCMQCHVSNSLSAAAPLGLFAAPDNTLCVACHSGPGALGIYVGPVPFQATAHWLSGGMLWPGPVPPARTPGQQGLCVNCHTPHGRGDGLGLIPSMGVAREESLCLTCHDGNGPAAVNIQSQLAKTSSHPVQGFAGRHQAAEGLNASAFGGALRHAECEDCHNPHAATATAPLQGVTRVGVQNGGANTRPTYVQRPATSASPTVEYELCFKCHSSYTTLPAGRQDLGLVFNPANASFHPVEGAGRNTSSAMTQSLAAGLGTPRLQTSSTITCSDCHGSESLPSNITRVSTYTGTEPVGPHGSNAATSTALSNAVLRAAYRVQLKSATASYARGDFALCFICHSPAPFESQGEDPRADTNFRYHALHVRRIGNEGNTDGDIFTPGSGRGVALCKECHANTHGTAGAVHPSNRTYARGVAFTANVTGSNGTGEPTWTPGSCNLRCHAKNHNPENY